MTPAARPTPSARRAGDAPRAAGPAAVAGLSIGGLAAATGVGVETLRAWERRYGRPRPARRASGHRRYAAEEVAWVRLVAAAVGAGARPSDVVGLSLADLRARVAPDVPPPRGWWAHLRRFDGAGLARAVERGAASAPDAAAFLDGALAPFLARVGARWAEGRLPIRHEHFASEVVGATLARLAALVRVPARAPTVVLATLSGERHVLGLASAALVAAGAGVRTRSLGPDTPVAEVAAAALETDAAAVAIAVSAAHGGPRTWRQLAALRAALPRGVPLVVGGAGAAGPRRRPPGIVHCGSFRAFAGLLEGLAAARSRPRR
ncbi:MAG: MerR family transcriptional regulator [Planctomycetota bacterium]